MKLTIDKNNNIFKYRNNINNIENNIYILFKDTNNDLFEDNLIQAIFEYQNLYHKVINNYKIDLSHNIHHKYNEDNNLLYLVKNSIEVGFKKISYELQVIISNILYEVRMNKKYENLYTYLPFNIEDQNNTYLELLNILSKYINIFILKNEQN